MRYELTLGDMVEAVQQHLDSDPRYFDQNEGCFHWADQLVHFVREPDTFVLSYQGETLTCVRP